MLPTKTPIPIDLRTTEPLSSSAVPEDEIHDKELRRIPDRIPWVVLLIIIVELGERFTYFGLSGPLQNYIKCVRAHLFSLLFLLFNVISN